MWPVSGQIAALTVVVISSRSTTHSLQAVVTAPFLHHLVSTIQKVEHFGPFRVLRHELVSATAHPATPRTMAHQTTLEARIGDLL